MLVLNLIIIQHCCRKDKSLTLDLNVNKKILLFLQAF
jgi:hypothetical protein